MREVILAPQAKEDLADIAVDISKDSPSAAESMMAAIDKRILLLAENPLAGRGLDELSQGLRSFPVGKYVIFYKVIDVSIRIVRVLHGARNIPELFQD